MRIATRTFEAYKETKMTSLSSLKKRNMSKNWTMEMASSVAVSQIIPVEWGKAMAVVVMAVLMRYPMLFSVEGSLQA